MRRIIAVRGVMVGMWVAALACAMPGRLTAQRGGGHFGGGHFGPGANFRAGFGGDFARYGGFGTVPLLDPLYMDALYSTGYPLAAQPPVIVLQAGGPARAEMAATAPSQPLMIELQDGRYVQVSGESRSGAQMLEGESSQPANRAVIPHSAPELPAAAVLVFRDGHREEVSGYTIADGVLYASGDVYRGRLWDRRIELSLLNLEETVQVNQARRVHFRLPTARNEVMVGF